MDFFGISKPTLSPDTLEYTKTSESNKNKNITFSKEELESFEKGIKDTPFYRSWCANKKDIKKFLFQLCKNHSEKSTSEKSTSEKSIPQKESKPNIKKSDIKKSDTKKFDIKKSDIKKSDTKKSDKEKNNSFKIIKVTKGFEYPSSTYNKENSKDASETALKAIIKKNKLGKNENFTFTLSCKDKEYKFNVKNGSIY